MPKTHPRKMRAAQFHAAGDVRVNEIDEPQAKAGQVLVEVEWGGICGTDLHEYLLGPLLIPCSGHPHSITGDTLPVTLCHEFCGRIAHVPDVGVKGAGGEALEVGTPVMVDARLNCGECWLCKGGHSNMCSSWGFLGLSGGGGGFAEKVAVRANMCYPLPEHVRLEDAAIIEPLAVGRHALTVSGFKEGEWKDKSVLVVGGGPVGYAVLCNLKALGVAKAYLSEPTTARQKQCSVLADEVFNSIEQKVPEECRKRTKEQAGVDVVFDCAGIKPGMLDGMAALRPKGTYVNVAGWETTFELPMHFTMLKELEIKMVMAYNDKDFGDTVRDFIAGK